MFSFRSLSADSSDEKKDPSIKSIADEFFDALSQTKELRQKADYFVLLNYSPLDLIIPSKLGFSFGYLQDADKTWEIEYLKGSVSVPFVLDDLGKMVDERFSVIARSYYGGNSFNISYGLTYFNFSLYLGDKLLNKVSSGSYPSLDLVEVQSLGYNFALGNRWSFKKNMTLGFDWFSWSQPIIIINKKTTFLDYATNQQDKDDVDRALKLISYFPRLSFLKIQFGMLF